MKALDIDRIFESDNKINIPKKLTNEEKILKFIESPCGYSDFLPCIPNNKEHIDKLKILFDSITSMKGGGNNESDEYLFLIEESIKLAKLLIKELKKSMESYKSKKIDAAIILSYIIRLYVLNINDETIDLEHFIRDEYGKSPNELISDLVGIIDKY